MTARSPLGLERMADYTAYDEPLELTTPPEDEADRLVRDWGTRRALEQANARVDYWRNVVARLTAQPPEIHWADLVGTKFRVRRGNRP